MKHSLIGLLVVLGSISSFSSCSKSTEPRIPELSGTPISAGDIPAGKSSTSTLSNGTEITVHNIGGKLYHLVESVLDDSSMASMGATRSALTQSASNTYLKSEAEKISNKLRSAGAIQLTAYEKVGYFSFLLPYESSSLMSALKGLSFSANRRLLINPVIVNKDGIKNIRAYGPNSESMSLAPSFRSGTENYSGLVRMGVPAFVKDAEKDIGSGNKVDGSSVRLGITDTGITYNHPTFLNADETKSRVTYMRDFTKEGRVYFSKTAKFNVLLPTNAADLADGKVKISAEYIATPKLPNMPLAETPKALNDMTVYLSSDLLAKLSQPGSGAKYGVLLEDSMQADADLVDINNNGKLDDALPIILIPGATPQDDLVYFDQTGTNDFRNVTPIHNFNSSGETVAVFAEKVGFDVREETLPSDDGSTKIPVRSVSIVGYDPGNHGSHVAGIAAGRKTLSDNSNDTLARGAAPAAQILLNRVCANNVGCNATEALIDLAINGQAEVINMSLGGLSPFNDGYGVEETIINRLTSVENVLFVISAGNSGPGRQTVGSPSTARYSLSVGAAASRGLIQRQYNWPGMASSSALTGQGMEDDFMLFFSSRGPTAAGGFKPMISAPGTELSSIQLNAARGSRSGLDVYWGTSMSAPSATGAYALFIDGIKKYNLANPGRELAIDAVTLRNVLVESARPFDMNSFNPATGEKSVGQYTWIDEGVGMINLPAAWKKLFQLRDSKAVSSINLAGKIIDPDYQVYVSATANPSGQTYDGTRPSASKTPAFGTGIYLDFNGAETLKQVHLARTLPQEFASSPDAGVLTRQLSTTHDEFVLKTVIYGSNKNWIKVGTLDQLNCMESETANWTVLGRGVEVNEAADGSGSLAPFSASTLNICIDRQMIANELPQGDNGALIYAYRTRNGEVSPVASFVVPVYVTVPHKTLAGNLAYENQGEVGSFGVNRNYVTIPKGTTVARVTLTVPTIKRDAKGLVAPGETCQGVELMALEGANTALSFSARSKARVSNCDATGTPFADTDPRRTLVVTRTNPTAGSWDLHVFGQYKFLKSKFNLRVDYVVAKASIDKIEGSPSVLTGSFTWSVLETSLAIAPSEAKSVFQLNGYLSKSQGRAAQGQAVLVPGPSGLLRKYGANVSKVVITTGQSAGNDIDLRVMRCDGSVAQPGPDDCELAGTSGGSDDRERVEFLPDANSSFIVIVDGYTINNSGSFVSTETQTVPGEKGTIKVTGQSPDFTIAYDLAMSVTGNIMKFPGFIAKQYQAVGDLTLKSDDGIVLDSIPVTISAP